MAKRIQDFDLGYVLFRRFVDLFLRNSYRRFRVIGNENIPVDGAIMLAPNHCNALMDALVVLSARKQSTVFGARADIFNNPLAAKLLTFLKILPMVRVRDGIRNVLKNRDTMDVITEVLGDNVPYCMFSEGTHRSKHSLLPIKKGIIRTAFNSDEQFGGAKKLYIMPVGLEYGDYYRFRSTVLVQIGEPINVTEILKEKDDEGKAELFREFGTELHDRIAHLITYIEDDEDYDAKWAMTRILNAGQRGNLMRRKGRNRNAVASIEYALEHDEERTRQMLAKALEFDEKRKKAKVSMYSFGHSYPILRMILKSIVAVLLLPFFVVATILSLPIWLPAEIIVSKTKDKSFWNTIRFCCKLVVSILMMLIIIIVGLIVTKWYWMLAALVAFLGSTNFFYDYCELIRILVSDYRLFFNKPLNDEYNSINIY